jgi:hypothetical protein
MWAWGLDPSIFGIISLACMRKRAAPSSSIAAGLPDEMLDERHGGQRSQ